MLDDKVPFTVFSESCVLADGLLTTDDVSLLLETRPEDARFTRVEVDTAVKKFQLSSLWLSRDGERLPAADTLSPEWSKLLDDLSGDEFLHRLGAAVDLPLWQLPRDVGLFTHQPGEFISPHHDEPEKAVTAVLYLNVDWPAGGGGEFEIRASRDPLAAPARSLAPEAGSFIAFDSSMWHATSTVDAGDRVLLAAVLEFWRVRPVR